MFTVVPPAGVIAEKITSCRIERYFLSVRGNEAIRLRHASPLVMSNERSFDAAVCRAVTASRKSALVLLEDEPITPPTAPYGFAVGSQVIRLLPTSSTASTNTWYGVIGVSLSS